MRVALFFFVWQQVVWWSAVLTGSFLATLLTVLGCALIVAMRLLPRSAWPAVISAAVLGFVVDLLLAWGLELRWRDAETFPLWLLMLWLSFAASLPTVFSAVWRFPRIGGLLMAALAPFSYLAATRLGAAEVANEARWWVALIIVWGLYPFVWRALMQNIAPAPCEPQRLQRG